MTSSQPSTDASIIESLRRNGYKATAQRIAICRFALNSHEHPTAQRIYREIKKVHPTVSLATVYKTLQVLGGVGMIRELPFAQGETRFDPDMGPHINVVCVRCGNFTDVNDGLARDLIARVASSGKFTVTGQRLDIYGLCEKCARRKTAR